MIRKFVCAGLLAGSTGAFAQGHDHHMTIHMVHDATKIALDDYIAANPAMADKVYAFQGTIVGTDAAVKLFVKNGTETVRVTYTCHHHDTGIECHLEGE